MLCCHTDPVVDAYLLHCLNHVAKTADNIKRNNDRLEQQQAKVGNWPAAVGVAAAGWSALKAVGDVRVHKHGDVRKTCEVAPCPVSQAVGEVVMPGTRGTQLV